MEIVKLFKSCYKEFLSLDKPVHYIEEFLKEFANKINKTNLVYEKYNIESSGNVSNFKLTDVALFGVVNTTQETNNLDYFMLRQFLFVLKI